MINEIINSNLIFENIKHVDEKVREYWLARELMVVLEYSKWQKFEEVIKKAQKACELSSSIVSDHFTQVGKMVNIGSQTTRKVLDYKLSRYACYLIAQNSDSRKKVVALAQTYFAIQTRRMELTDKEYSLMSEDEKRLYQRDLTRKGNYSLNKTASAAGVRNFAKFHNAGDKGLYGGETADDIAKRKGLRYREEILDNMGSEELVDNLFRIVQTDRKIKRDNINNEMDATNTHFNMGKDIREFIKSQGGTMPEELETPNKSLKEVEKSKYSKLID